MEFVGSGSLRQYLYSVAAGLCAAGLPECAWGQAMELNGSDDQLLLLIDTLHFEVVSMPDKYWRIDPE